MKKIAIILAALAASVGMNAQDSKSSYSVTTDFTYSSEYIFRGIESADASFQPSVELAMGDFYVGLWTNQPVTKHANNEIDIYLGQKFKMNDQLSFEVVGTYYWYPEARTSLGETKHSYEAGVGATYTVSGISTSVYYYYDFRLEANTVQGSVGYSLPLEALGASLDLSVFYGTVDGKDFAPDALGSAVSQSYSYYGADVSIPYKLNDHATVTTGVHYATNENVPPGTADNNLWFSVGLSVGF